LLAKDNMVDLPIKKCIKCEKEFLENNIFFCLDKRTNKLSSKCKKCLAEQRKVYKLKNREEILKKAKEYRKQNKEKIYKNRRDNYLKYKPISSRYRRNNKVKILAQKLKYKYIKYHNDPCFKLNYILSSTIRQSICKNNKSFIKNLNYTIIELKQHLESQFEYWMNWNNWSTYNLETWDNNNSSTWTWNIDHIIPKSKLPYFSMEDDNFKICWALENLRPYSSKQNILDGNK